MIGNHSLKDIQGVKTYKNAKKLIKYHIFFLIFAVRMRSLYARRHMRVIDSSPLDA